MHRVRLGFLEILAVSCALIFRRSRMVQSMLSRGAFACSHKAAFYTGETLVAMLTL